MFKFAHRGRKSGKSMARAVRAVSMLAVLIALAVPFGPSNAAEDAKWFVLRHDQTGDCWTALLIKIDGDYQHEFAQKASDPYATKAEALKREKDLERNGTCKETSQQ